MKNIHHRVHLFCITLVALGAFVVPTADAQNYAITDLGTLGGTNSQAYSINNHGQIVGVAALSNGWMHAFMYDDGMMSDLGTLGGTNSQANFIDDAGHMVGTADMPGENHHAFLATNGPAGMTMMDLFTLGGTNSEAYCVTTNGMVVGTAQLADGDHHAFLATNQIGRMMMSDLHTLGGPSSIAYGMNGRGQVVGASDLSGGGYLAFMTTNGGTAMMSGMGTFGGPSSVAHSINNTGQTVGLADMPGGNHQAFMSGSGMMGGGMMMSNLGTLGGTNSAAYCINNLDQVVGTAQTPDGTNHAFLYNGGMMQDLNQMIPPSSGWLLTEARSINDAQQIVGSGMTGGQVHGFLMTPVTSAMTMMAAPVSQTVSPGGMVTMGVTMNASEPLTYQWMLNGMKLPGQTDSTLVVTNAGFDRAGRYTVVINNHAGMVANSSADLVLFAMHLTNQLAELTIAGPMGSLYQVEATPHLGDPHAWTVVTNFTLGDGPHTFEDPEPASFTNRFYRAHPRP